MDERSSHPTSAEDEIEAQRENLRVVRSCEAQIARLREQEVRLEVDCLAAEAAARGARAKGAGIAASAALDIGAALTRHQELQRTLAEQQAREPAVPASQLEVACAALESWLAAPDIPEPTRMRSIARGALLVLTAAAVWAAIAVHPAFLLVLAPVVVPLTLLLRAGENTGWRQLGAKRRFEQSGLAPPERWEADAVRDRLTVLSERLPAPTDGGPVVTVQMVDEAQAALRSRLDEAGIDSLDEDLEGWIRKVSDAARVRAALEAVQAERAAVTTEAGDAREAVFRFLARRRAAPSGGQADLAMLEAALSRVSRR